MIFYYLFFLVILKPCSLSYSCHWATAITPGLCLRQQLGWVFPVALGKVCCPLNCSILGMPVMVSTIPESLSSLPQWSSFSVREKAQRMFFPSKAEEPWAGPAQNALYMGLSWLTQTQSCPVGFGLKEFRKSSGRNKKSKSTERIRHNMKEKWWALIREELSWIPTAFLFHLKNILKINSFFKRVKMSHSCSLGWEPD